MNNVRRLIDEYVPGCEQEVSDRQQMLSFMDSCGSWLTRDNAMAHVTVSAWVVDPERTRVLMAYHNIYDSWAWTGGHADGESDLVAVAIKEVREETGVEARPVSDKPISIESLNVVNHIKRGRFVSSHIHMNVTYLLEADPAAHARMKPDENSGVMWIPFEKVETKVSEEAMKPIYRKLMGRARSM